MELLCQPSEQRRQILFFFNIKTVFTFFCCLPAADFFLPAVQVSVCHTSAAPNKKKPQSQRIKTCVCIESKGALAAGQDRNAPHARKPGAAGAALRPTRPGYKLFPAHDGVLSPMCHSSLLSFYIHYIKTSQKKVATTTEQATPFQTQILPIIKYASHSQTAEQLKQSTDVRSARARRPFHLREWTLTEDPELTCPQASSAPKDRSHHQVEHISLSISFILSLSISVAGPQIWAQNHDSHIASISCFKGSFPGLKSLRKSDRRKPGFSHALLTPELESSPPEFFLHQWSCLFLFFWPDASGKCDDKLWENERIHLFADQECVYLPFLPGWAAANTLKVPDVTESVNGS